MRKILFLLLLLCSMTAAWAGEGDGSKEKPYTGEWQASKLISQLKEGKHLAYDCVIKSDSEYIGIFVFDDKINPNNTTKIIDNWTSWGVGYAISEDKPLPKVYQDYYSLNSAEDRKNHTFIVTKVETKAEYYGAKQIYITGHYSGHYDRGDGTKENPYCGEWLAGEMGQILKPGDHLAYDCKIVYGFVYVTDDKFDIQIAYEKDPWCVGDDAIGDTPHEAYIQYCEDNPNRKDHTFIVSSCNVSAYSSLNIKGHYSGLYLPEGFVRVASAEQMWNVLQKDDHAKIILMQDIYLSEIRRDSEPLCSTFYGILDGNGHTIYGANYGDNPEKRRRERTYLFKYTEGATIKNLTIKDIMIDGEEDSQAIITTVSRSGCVYENITFDNCFIWSSKHRVGAVAGSATAASTFNNIKVMNSYFSVKYSSVGAVVGYVVNVCTFTNIDVINCQIYAHDDNAGGVAGYAHKSNFTDVTIHSGHYKADGLFAGGVVGKANGVSTFTHCVTKDQVSVWADGMSPNACVGGIVGYAEGGCSFLNCINSAIVSADGNCVGGIVGLAQTSEEYPDRPIITGCLNTGLIVSQVAESDVPDLCDKYKTKQMTCVTKNYNGTEYTIRSYKKDEGLIPPILTGSRYYLGGIGGAFTDADISQCANIGVLCSYWVKCVGGIAGEAKTCNITDCLVDAEINKANDTQVSAIASRMYLENKPLSISNCLAFVKPSYSDHDVCIYIDAAGDTIDVDKSSDVPYGLYCYKLGDNWEQNIGTDEYPTPTGSKGVYHSRKISNEYGTACLPFAVKSDDKISYYTFSEATEGDDINLKFTYVEDVEPGTPVLFRSAEAEDADNPVEICINNAGDSFTGTTKTVYGNDRWTMQGTFSGIVMENAAARNAYYVSGGAIRHSSTVEIAPCRAYFRGPSIYELTAEGKSVTFSLDDEDGTVTTLRYENDTLRYENDTLRYENDNGKVYTIMGTEAPAGYKGIVIKNGKKVMIK